MFGRLLRRDSHASGIAPALYGAIVAQARTPALYADFRVPDTVEGRFEMVVLHTALVIRRLGEGDPQAREVGQEIFDLFCEDMDRSLRDMGVGDLAVPKRMRSMAEAFYGRSAAYDSALAANHPAELAATVRRIVFAGNEPGMATDGLAHYIIAAATALSALSLSTGRLPWPDPSAFIQAG